MPSRAFCDVCEKNVQPVPAEVNNLFYLVLSVVTFGVGLLFWGLAALTADGRYRCPICRATITKAYQDAMRAEEAERKARDREFMEKHGLPWWPYRLMALALYLNLLILMVLAREQFNIDVPWQIFLPILIVFLSALAGSDLAGFRGLVDRDDDPLSFVVGGLIWFVGIPLVLFAISYAYAFFFPSG
jgi:hypothetical protein